MDPNDRTPASFSMPHTPQAKNALKYILASQKACTSEDWIEIIRIAVEDAKNAGNQRTRSEARKFLAGVLMPRDPVQLLQVFAPQHSLEELREQLRELRELQSRMSELSTIDERKIHDVIEDPVPSSPDQDDRAESA